jgi:hypothetical protein
VFHYKIRILSSGIWRRVARYKSTDLSEECTTSFFRSRRVSQAYNHQEADSKLKMEAVCSSQTSTSFYRTIRRHIPGDSNVRTHRFENVRSKTESRVKLDLTGVPYERDEIMSMDAVALVTICRCTRLYFSEQRLNGRQNSRYRSIPCIFGLHFREMTTPNGTHFWLKNLRRGYSL